MAENLYEMTPEERDAMTKANAQKAYQGLLAQKDAAVGGISAAEKGLAAIGDAEKGALGDVRNKSALAFTAQQGRGGGGTLAGMRQSQLARGVAEGSTRGDYAQRKALQEQEIQQARATAAKAETEFATESEKLSQAASAYAGAESAGYDAALADFNAYIDENVAMFATDADRNAALEIIARKVATEQNPNKKAGMVKAMNDIKSGKANTGKWDTNRDWF